MDDYLRVEALTSVNKNRAVKREKHASQRQMQGVRQVKTPFQSVLHKAVIEQRQKDGKQI